MRIVIIGAGKVGTKLAKQLSEENHDIVLIDQNTSRLKEFGNKLDIICIQGNGADQRILLEADIANAELTIACTSEDEINMLSCLIARKLGAQNTVARIRDPIYYEQIGLLQEELQLSMVINPELAVAREISRVLIFPSANQVETFVKDRVELVEIPVKEESPIIGMNLAELYRRFKIKILVCGVKREEDVFIPDGSYVPLAGDKIYVTSSHMELERFFKRIDAYKKKIKKVMIVGGSRVGFYLAKQLCDMHFEVKIIDRSRTRCEELSELLPKATIICGNGGDDDLLLEENIEEADAFVALTGMDEENIITGLFAKNHGVGKIIVKVNEESRARMAEGLGMDRFVSAKISTADAIISYVRARQNSYSSADVEAMYHLMDEQIEAMEFRIRKEARYTNLPLKDIKFKPNHLIACIVRDRKIIIPNGSDHMQIGDNVVIVTKNKKLQAMEDILL